MTELQFASLALNFLLGIFMYTLKQRDEQRERAAEALSVRLGKVEDTYFKKEDFREFKEELWVRLDKMEVTFEKRQTYHEKN